MLKSAVKSYCFGSSDFMSRPFCSHLLCNKMGKFGRVFCKQTNVATCRFQNECNKVEIALRVVQFLSEIKLVIANRKLVITRLISDQIALRLHQAICRCNLWAETDRTRFDSATRIFDFQRPLTLIQNTLLRK